MNNMLDKGIIIVDDESGIRDTLKRFLKGYGYQNIYEASDGLECVNILAEHGENIHLVLLDLMMPNMSGMDVIKHLVNVHKHIVGIIVITGHSSIDTAIKFAKGGNDKVLTINYIEKPFNHEKLLPEIDRTIKLIDEKRKNQNTQHDNHIEHKIDSIELNTNQLLKRVPNFITQIGLDVIRIIIIALTVLCFYYIGLDGFIRNIINK